MTTPGISLPELSVALEEQFKALRYKPKKPKPPRKKRVRMPLELQKRIFLSMSMRADQKREILERFNQLPPPEDGSRRSFSAWAVETLLRVLRETAA